MTDRQKAFEQLAREYERQTGVKVTFELFAPPDIYSQKVRAAAQGNNLPDIFGILGEKRDFASFVRAGFVLDLTAYMDADAGAWKKMLVQKAVDTNSFSAGNGFGVRPGIYGVPLDMTAIKMVYNKDLLARLGGDPRNPPSTLEDFLALAPKVREQGLQGFVTGGAELWMMDCLAGNYAFNIMGRDKVLRTLKGEVPYTDPDWIKVFEVFSQMQSAGMVTPGVVTMINKTAEQLFANGKAVFALNGSWGVNVYKGMNPSLDFGVALLPRASGANPMSFWASAGSSFLVNGRSQKKEKAVAFLKWLSGAEQQVFLSSATNNLPANRDAAKDMPQALAGFARDMGQATHPNTWDMSEFPEVIEALDKGIQSLVIGEKSPEQVAREVQRVKDRMVTKKGR
ncbi:MAG: ABC transporter substrate-binding protein [Deltaproteobacteria bacterium]